MEEITCFAGAAARPRDCQVSTLRISRFGDHYKSNGYTRYNFLFEQNTVLSLISKKEKSLILDVGCGTGHLVRPLLDNNRVVGIDICRDILNYAKNKGLRVIQSDGQSLPLYSGLFDVVLCIHVAQTVQDINRLIEEIARVTKKNGEIVIATLNAMFIVRRLFKMFIFNQRYLKTYKIRDVIKILSQNGLSDIEIVYDYEPFLFKRISTDVRLIGQFLAASFIIRARKIG